MAKSSRRRKPAAPPAPSSSVDFSLVGTRGKSPAEARVIKKGSPEAVRRAIDGRVLEQLNKCAAITAEYLAQGVDVAEVVELVLEWNEDGDPPAPVEEVRQVVYDAVPLAAAAPACEGQGAVDPDVDELSEAESERRGFPRDWWLPADLAADWQSSSYPKELTAESVMQWRRLMEQSAQASAAAGWVEQAGRIRGRVEADCRLLEAHLSGCLAADPRRRELLEVPDVLAARNAVRSSPPARYLNSTEEKRLGHCPRKHTSANASRTTSDCPTTTPAACWPDS
jgi:hypothetical protein